MFVAIKILKCSNLDSFGIKIWIFQDLTGHKKVKNLKTEKNLFMYLIIIININIIIISFLERPRALWWKSWFSCLGLQAASAKNVCKPNQTSQSGPWWVATKCSSPRSHPTSRRSGCVRVQLDLAEDIFCCAHCQQMLRLLSLRIHFPLPSIFLDFWLLWSMCRCSFFRCLSSLKFLLAWGIHWLRLPISFFLVFPLVCMSVAVLLFTYSIHSSSSIFAVSISSSVSFVKETSLSWSQSVFCSFIIWASAVSFLSRFVTSSARVPLLSLALLFWGYRWQYVPHLVWTLVFHFSRHRYGFLSLSVFILVSELWGSCTSFPSWPSA